MVDATSPPSRVEYDVTSLGVNSLAELPKRPSARPLEENCMIADFEGSNFMNLLIPPNFIFSSSNFREISIGEIVGAKLGAEYVESFRMESALKVIDRLVEEYSVILLELIVESDIDSTKILDRFLAQFGTLNLLDATFSGYKLFINISVTKGLDM